VTSIAPLGSTGSLPYLDDEEREAVAETTVKAVAGRVPVMVGVSSLTTELPDEAASQRARTEGGLELQLHAHGRDPPGKRGCAVAPL
jgi:hypothetical protein